MSPQQAKQFVPILRVWADSGKHPPVALDRPVCVIGRRQGANLPLRAPQVSNVHALIIRERGRVYLRDLASTNGVQCNGSPVLEVGLRDEDTVRIGSYTLRCASGFARNGVHNGDDAPASDSSEPPPLPAAELRTDGATYPFPTDRHTLLIGRRDRCDIHLRDPSVESVHAIVFEMDGRRYIHDLGTDGGTLLNGQAIHRAELNPGDEVRIGLVNMRFVLSERQHTGEPPGELPPVPLIEDDIEMPIAPPPNAEPDMPTIAPPIPQPAVEVTNDFTHEAEEAAPVPRPPEPALEGEFAPAEQALDREPDLAISSMKIAFSDPNATIEDDLQPILDESDIAEIDLESGTPWTQEPVVPLESLIDEPPIDIEPALEDLSSAMDSTPDDSVIPLAPIEVKDQSDEA